MAEERGIGRRRAFARAGGLAVAAALWPSRTGAAAPAAVVQTNQSGMSAGPLAERPAASGSRTGQVYLATDVAAGTMFWCTGSSWVAMAPGVLTGQDTVVQIGQGDWTPGAGVKTTDRSTTGANTPAWRLDRGDRVDVMLMPGRLPAHWRSVDIDVHGYGVNAAGGNLALQLASRAASVGSPINPKWSRHRGVIAPVAATSRTAMKIRAASGVTVDPGQYLRLSLTRLNVRQDTYRDAWRFIGSTVSRAS